jgi:hypothetical protein
MVIAVTIAAARPQIRFKRCFVTVVAVITVICGLAGCSFYSPSTPIPERSSIVGVWEHSGPRGIVTKIDFSNNGHLHLSDAPAQVFMLYGTPGFRKDSTVDWSQLVSRTGTWHLAKGRSGGQPYLDVDVHSTKISPSHTIDGAQTVMYIDGTGENMKISVVQGMTDNDVLFTFERK